ncbi:MAG: PhnD/SsuA/transferrin family substrate-binding protein [Myxococcota bacterium]
MMVRINAKGRERTTRRSIGLALCSLLVLLAPGGCDKASTARPEAATTPETQPSASAGAEAASASKKANDAVDPQRAKTLIWGTIADNPTEAADKAGEWTRFLEYVVDNLGSYGIEDSKLVFCHSPGEMADWMRDGKVDLFDESPFAAYLVNQIGHVDEPLLNRWKNGNEKFGSVIFASAKGGIDSLDDLLGKMVVFRGDTSTTQYFLPKAFLVEKGYTLVEKNKPSDPVGANEVGYYFAWSSRDKQVEDVMDGLAAAGGNSDEFVEQLLGHTGKRGGSARHPRKGTPQAQKSDLRIIARVPGVLRRLVTVRKDLDPELKDALKQMMLHMHETPEGRAVLATFGPASRFTVADTPKVAYAGISDKGALVEAEVEKFSKLR